MNPYLDKQCRHYSSKESAMSSEQIDDALKFTPEWQFKPATKAIIREFGFTDYHQTIRFVNKVAKIADKQDHHPELVVTYNRCKIEFSTHSINNLTDNDFICAAQIDALLQD